VVRGSCEQDQRLSVRVPGTACEHTPGDTQFCRSKTLGQYTEELHYRRSWLADNYDVAHYTALADPFPTETLAVFGEPGEQWFINPAHCRADQVDPSFSATSNAVVRVNVLP